MTPCPSLVRAPRADCPAHSFAEELDPELGALQHAALYLAAAGSRRLAAMLRREHSVGE
jgi:hypothetical protein